MDFLRLLRARMTQLRNICQPARAGQGRGVRVLSLPTVSDIISVNHMFPSGP